VHHDRVHPHQLQQHHIGRELFRHGALAHGVTAVFDDHGLAVIHLNIRQGLGERLRRFPAAFLGLALGFVHHRREIAGDGGGVTGKGSGPAVGVQTERHRWSVSLAP